MARCDLGERSAVALGNALANTSPLEDLDLSWNRLGLKGARALAAGIRESMEVCMHLFWLSIMVCKEMQQYDKQVC